MCIRDSYCSVHCVWTLKKNGCEAILVNNNPETVSTDFDTGDRLSVSYTHLCSSLPASLPLPG